MEGANMLSRFKIHAQLRGDKVLEWITVKIIERRKTAGKPYDDLSDDLKDIRWEISDLEAELRRA